MKRDEGLGHISTDVLDRLMTDTGHDHDLLGFVLRTYQDTAPGRLASLQQAVGAGDRAAAAQHAHDLASTSGQVGALGISQVAREIEALSVSGEASPADHCARIAAALPGALAEIQGITDRYASSRR